MTLMSQAARALGCLVYCSTRRESGPLPSTLLELTGANWSGSCDRTGANTGPPVPATAASPTTPSTHMVGQAKPRSVKDNARRADGYLVGVWDELRIRMVWRCQLIVVHLPQHICLAHVCLAQKLWQDRTRGVVFAERIGIRDKIGIEDINRTEVAVGGG